MKRTVILFFLLLILPVSVYASGNSKCEVISGSGKDIGDEVACGTEHFYILDADGNDITLLSKYNLYVGYIVNDARIDQMYENSDEAEAACSSLGPDYQTISWYSNYHDKTFFYCRSYSELSYSTVKQDSRAISAHGDESGKPEFPEIGDIYITGFNEYSVQPNIDAYQEHYYADAENTATQDYLRNYNSYLSDEGFSINNIRLLMVSDIYYLNKKLNGTNMNLIRWAQNATLSPDLWPVFETHYIYGSLKEYFSDDYSWLWATTYWLDTVDDHTYIFFVDTLGELCSGSLCPAGLGAGVRPVISLNKNNIEETFEVKPSDEQGIVLTRDYYAPGKTVTFKVKEKEGFEIEGVIITDENGNQLNYRKTSNENEYEFEMPEGNVIITPSYRKIVNPKTGLLIYLVVLLVLVALIPIIGRRKNKQIIEEA